MCIWVQMQSISGMGMRMRKMSEAGLKSILIYIILYFILFESSINEKYSCIISVLNYQS